jgi:hypothetical protein
LKNLTSTQRSRCQKAPLHHNCGGVDGSLA